jgi:hypothetical protein
MSYRKTIAVLAVLLMISGIAYADKVDEKEVKVLDSYVEFPVIVFVGQVVNLTPHSIIFENRHAETKATNEKIKRLMDGYASSTDPRSHGFAKALKVVSVVNKKMRASFYLDNITSVFADDMQNYMKFLPLYYLLKNNIKTLKFPKSYVDKFKKLSMDYYLTLPMAEKIMKNSWFVGVFRIDTETSKLIYQSSNYYDSIDKLMTDDFAKEFMVPQIVKAGMVMSVTKAKIRGHESKWVKDKIGNDSKSEKKGFHNQKTDNTGEGRK